VTALSTFCRARGYDVRAIRSPTVPKGTERVRVTLHAHNNVIEVLRLVEVLEFWAKEVWIRDCGEVRSRL
jgi:8-amino-7-oxononanoate synthase